MRFLRMCGALTALSMAVSSGVVSAAAAEAAAAANPTPINVIFEHKHLANVEQGKEIGYKFHRIVSDTHLLGEPFSDAITLKVVAAKPSGEKDVDLQIYTGERARELQKLPGVTINPVFVVYFDLAVSSLHKLTGAKYNKLKVLFSNGFKDRAKIEPVKVDYQGKSIDAYRITMSPYSGNPLAPAMQGYEGSKFTLVVSDHVPGEIVQMTAVYESTLKEAPKLEERFTLDGVQEAKQ